MHSWVQLVVNSTPYCWQRHNTFHSTFQCTFALELLGLGTQQEDQGRNMKEWHSTTLQCQLQPKERKKVTSLVMSHSRISLKLYGKTIEHDTVALLPFSCQKWHSLWHCSFPPFFSTTPLSVGNRWGSARESPLAHCSKMVAVIWTNVPIYLARQSILLHLSHQFEKLFSGNIEPHLHTNCLEKHKSPEWI